MAQLVRRALEGDFAGAREIHRRFHPLMEVNFVESNSDPGEGGDGGNGTARADLALAACAAKGGESGRGSRACLHRLDWSRECMRPSQIERLFDEPPSNYTDKHFGLFEEFKQALNRGEVRAAEPDASAKTGWRVNAWVKKGILLGFRMGSIVDMSIDASAPAILRQVDVSGAKGRRRPTECASCRAAPAFATAATSAAA